MFFRELALRPNCLLTRKPIRLVPGPYKGWLRNPWKGLRNYLYQHGYQITMDEKVVAHVLCGKAIPASISPGSTLTIIKKTPEYSEDFFSHVLDLCITLAELDYLED